MARKRPRWWMSLLGWLFTLGFTAAVLAAAAGIMVFQHYAKNLPDYTALASYNPPTVTRLYASDGKLLAEYATEKRVFMPLSAMPRRVMDAFISAEDKNFYTHQGVDFMGVARAIYTNIVHYGQGKSLVGGSTITQQVVKNFLLTDEKSLERKVKEAILAMRISRAYSKEKILELYLNEIFLGLRSYGVAAAALNYFNKSLNELTLEEVALLAAMPKAPHTYDPRRNYEQAKTRRDWVIRRMQEDGKATREEAEAAIAQPITLQARSQEETVRAEFFAEEVRRWLAQKYGEDALYKGGMAVKTTLDPALQEAADAALRKTLVEYDRKRGYRGALAKLDMKGEWQKQLEKKAEAMGELLPGQRLAVVKSLEEKKANIIFSDGKLGTIPMPLLSWTRRVLGDGVLASAPRRPSDIFQVGDVVMVGPLDAAAKKTHGDTAWDLQQVPAANGALVVIDPQSGKVLAMSGGYSAANTSFNRATQAQRQPGSAFKPFVYLSALEAGLPPNTIVLDAPVELSQGEGLPTWKPGNYGDTYLGPVTMREGLEKSRNTMTVRIAQMLGIERIMEIGRRFAIYEKPQRNFSIVLGSAETSLLRMVNAYGMLVNGGKRIWPSLIERIDDRNGKVIFKRDARRCAGCSVEDAVTSTAGLPAIQEEREQVVDPRLAYQMVSMLQGVVLRGTAMKAAALGKPLAGKTGTTNNSRDAWFVGFSPELAVGVYVGFDKPRTLGMKETGGSVALPAFIDFMKTALKDKPMELFRIPPGISLERIDYHTGMPVVNESPEQKIIQEAFLTGEPPMIPQSAREFPMVMQPTLPMENGGGMGAEITVQDAPPQNQFDLPAPLPGNGTGGLY